MIGPCSVWLPVYLHQTGIDDGSIKDVVIEIVSAGFVYDVSIEGNLIEAGFLQQIPQPLLERLAERDVSGLGQD